MEVQASNTVNTDVSQSLKATIEHDLKLLNQQDNGKTPEKKVMGLGIGNTGIGNKKIPCPAGCGRAYSTDASLRNHIRLKHYERRMLKSSNYKRGMNARRMSMPNVLPIPLEADLVPKPRRESADFLDSYRMSHTDSHSSGMHMPLGRPDSAFTSTPFNTHIPSTATQYLTSNMQGENSNGSPWPDSTQPPLSSHLVNFPEGRVGTAAQKLGWPAYARRRSSINSIYKPAQEMRAQRYNRYGMTSQKQNSETTTMGEGHKGGATSFGGSINCMALDQPLKSPGLMSLPLSTPTSLDNNVSVLWNYGIGNVANHTTPNSTEAGPLHSRSQGINNNNFMTDTPALNGYDAHTNSDFWNLGVNSKEISWGSYDSSNSGNSIGLFPSMSQWKEYGQRHDSLGDSFSNLAVTPNKCQWSLPISTNSDNMNMEVGGLDVRAESELLTPNPYLNPDRLVAGAGGDPFGLPDFNESLEDMLQRTAQQNAKFQRHAYKHAMIQNQPTNSTSSDLLAMSQSSNQHAVRRPTLYEANKVLSRSLPMESSFTPSNIMMSDLSKGTTRVEPKRVQNYESSQDMKQEDVLDIVKCFDDKSGSSDAPLTLDSLCEILKTYGESKSQSLTMF